MSGGAWLRDGVGLGIGVVAALGVGIGDSREAPNVPEAPITATVASAEVPSAPCPTEEEREAERARLTQQLETTTLLRQLQEARRVEREGVAQPWTGDIDARLHPERFEPAVRAAAAQVGFEVLGFDCAEHPCVARVVQPVGEPGGSSLDVLDPLLEALAADGYADLRPIYRTASKRSDGASHVMFALASPEPGAEVVRRVEHRVGQARELVRAWHLEAP